MVRMVRMMIFLTVCSCFCAHYCLAEENPPFVKQIQELAGQGDGEAQLALALMYEYGEQGLEQDQEKALTLFQQSAQAGLSAACLYLGIKYDNGSGVGQDAVAAARWYCCAARKGWAMAQFFLAALYEKGKGVGKDRITAFAWYGLAAEQGYPGAEEARNRLSAGLTKREIKKAVTISEKFQVDAVDCSRL